MLSGGSSGWAEFPRDPWKAEVIATRSWQPRTCGSSAAQELLCGEAHATRPELAFNFHYAKVVDA